jgi:hypothetical protein
MVFLGRSGDFFRYILDSVKEFTDVKIEGKLLFCDIFEKDIDKTINLK